MSDARFILDLPSHERVEGKKKKKKNEKSSDLTGSGVRTKAQRELDKLLRDQKLYLGAQSDVFQEVKKEVRQSLMEEKKRLAEEEWQRVVEDRQSQRKRRWALYTRVPPGRQIAQIHWAPLPEPSIEASEEVYEPPVSPELLTAPACSTAGLTLTEEEWVGVEKNCTFPDPWTFTDARLLLDVAMRFSYRWFVIADRVQFSFSKHDRTGTPIGADAVALLFYSIAHYVISQRFRDDPERWYQHPLSVYSTMGEAAQDSYVGSVMPPQRDFHRCSPQQKIMNAHPDNDCGGSGSIARYTHLIVKYHGKYSCQMHSLHNAVTCAKEAGTTPIENEVSELIEKYVRPHLFLASDAVHEKIGELKNRISSFLNARHQYTNTKENLEN